MRGISPAVKTYLKVYVGLLALLAATVAAIYINLGPFNIVLTMAIAMAKAFLVVTFFMHIRANARVIWIYAMLGIIWISFLVGGTLTDVLTR
jgi:cytochrome c oxidase subunit 4